MDWNRVLDRLFLVDASHFLAARSDPEQHQEDLLMEILPLGDSALILRIRQDFEHAPEETLTEVLGVFDFLRRANIPGITEFAPAYTSVAAFYEVADVIAAGAAPDRVFEWLSARIHTVIANGEIRLKRSALSSIEIPVCYDEEFGFDLGQVAHHAGLSKDEAVDLHCGAEYRVHCLGFTPGFPYLSGMPTALAMPRRPVPRKQVPAGSVAIGGTQTGVYPLESPGGWNVIGRTPLRLFDAKKNPPALLYAGDRVRFRSITRSEFDGLKG